jgi:hypothetical protein
MGTSNSIETFIRNNDCVVANADKYKKQIQICQENIKEIENNEDLLKSYQKVLDCSLALEVDLDLQRKEYFKSFIKELEEGAKPLKKGADIYAYMMLLFNNRSKFEMQNIEELKHLKNIGFFLLQVDGQQIELTEIERTVLRKNIEKIEVKIKEKTFQFKKFKSTRKSKKSNKKIKKSQKSYRKVKKSVKSIKKRNIKH